MQVAEAWMTDYRAVGLSVDVMGALIWSTMMPDLVVLMEPRGAHSLARVGERRFLYNAQGMHGCLQPVEPVRLFHPDGGGIVERWVFAISPEGLVGLYSMYRGITIPHNLLSIGQAVIHTGLVACYDKLQPWGPPTNGEPFGILR